MKNTISFTKPSWLNIESVTMFLLMALILVAPTGAWAQTATTTTSADFTSASGGACQFIKNIHTILNLMSVAVVTIAIIFAGYQIAFAHKRISDVAPILIGGLLIGAAGQIAKMLVSTPDSCSAALQTMQYFA